MAPGQCSGEADISTLNRLDIWRVREWLTIHLAWRGRSPIVKRSKVMALSYSLGVKKEPWEIREEQGQEKRELRNCVAQLTDR